jgi:hydrogenase maturation protease
MKTLIVGLGNPILGDDAVGWCVAEQVKSLLNGHSDDTHIECLAVGGLRLMEEMIGYDRAIVVDSLTTFHNPIGTVSCFPLEALPNLAAGHITSAHDTTLQTALDMGKKLGYPLPDTVTIVGIEAQNVLDFSEELSPPVAAAVHIAAQLVLDQITKREDATI